MDKKNPHQKAYEKAKSNLSSWFDKNVIVEGLSQKSNEALRKRLKDKFVEQIENQIEEELEEEKKRE